MTPFWKFEAAGNDFVVFNTSERPSAPNPETIQKICDRHLGIGADGVIYLWSEASSKSLKWQWAFYNSDGSSADVCGNALRAVACWFEESKLSLSEKAEWTWLGATGPIRARRRSLPTGKAFSVHWAFYGEGLIGEPSESLMETLCGFNDFGLAGAYQVDAGVPHLVLLNHEIWPTELRLSNNSLLRSFPSLGAAGANVTWLSLKDKSVVTFERGVEAETQACGSGALAAFLAFGKYKSDADESFVQSEQVFHFPGGDLQVHRESASELWLTGSARLVFTGQYGV